MTPGFMGNAACDQAGLALVDSAGLNDQATHTERVLQYLRIAIAYVCLVNATPGVTNSVSLQKRLTVTKCCCRPGQPCSRCDRHRTSARSLCLSSSAAAIC